MDRGSSISRRVLGGALAVAGAQVLARLLSLPASPYLTRVLGPEPYGVAALISTISGLAAAAALLGLDVGYAKYSLKPEGLDAAKVESFCWRTALAGAGVAGGLAGLAIVGFRGSAGEGLDGSWSLAAMTWGLTILTVATAMAVARRRVDGRYVRIGLATVSGAAVAVGLNVGAAAWWRADEWAILGGSAVGMTLTLVLLGVPRIPLRGGGLGRSEARAVLAVGAVMTATAPAYWVIAWSDRWWVARFAGEGALGIYNYSAQFGLLGQIVATGVAMTWLPEIARPRDAAGSGGPEIGTAWERVVVVFVAVWLLLALLGPEAVRLLAAPSFHAGSWVVAPVAAGALLNGFVQLGVAGLVLASGSRRLLVPWTVCALLSAGLNALLIPRLGWGAAPWVNVVAMGILSVWLGAEALRRVDVRVRWARVVAGGATATAFVALATVLPQGPPLTNLLWKVPLALAASVLVAGAIRREDLRTAAALLTRRPARDGGEGR
ncbi:MAG: lipopolysaccharide biosynthesis protein [Thermoanaerobaculia bacterium]